MRGRPGVAALLGVVTLAGLTACSSGSALGPRATAGTATEHTVVLLDDAARPAVSAGIDDFVAEARAEVVSAAGTPAAVAGSVKDGEIVDVVVLPAGADLERITDELVADPAPVGRAGGTTYFAAAVTARGLPFAQYLTTARGRQVLLTHGVTPTSDAPSG